MLAAAAILHEPAAWKVAGPTCYLLGYDIEVALKSFLLANGESLDGLKQKLGHKIVRPAASF